MRVEFTESIAGERFVYRPGEKVDLRDDIARDFIKQGVARAIADDGTELAIAAAPEHAAKRIVRRVRRGLGLPG
jgi:hypothetical protein